jgi:branched-chain amino acid transport system ATP-binding protein
MALLEAEGINVGYGGIQALRDARIAVEAGRIAGLIGPNGAGKSTMLGVLSGLVRPQSGRVVLDGTDITRKPPHRRARLGMARSFQRLELWGSMTVRQNIETAAEFTRRRNRSSLPRATADRLLKQLGLETVADVTASSLPSGTARVVEVARAVATSPRVLLLDEPSAGLDEAEARELADSLVDLASDGMAVLLVEHHVEVVMRACAEIWVLDYGSLIAHGPASFIRESQAVQDAYLGSMHATGA